MRAYSDPKGFWLATRQSAKIGPPPSGVALGSPQEGVASLVRATSPACAPLLPSELPRAITVLQSLQDRL
jgi:hypothetical protein